MNIYSIAYVIPLMALCGCSAKGVYNARPSSELIECRKQPPAADQKCLEQIHKTYDKYMREREEALKD